jgi:hypothetical protein
MNTRKERQKLRKVLLSLSDKMGETIIPGFLDGKPEDLLMPRQLYLSV